MFKNVGFPVRIFWFFGQVYSLVFQHKFAFVKALLGEEAMSYNEEGKTKYT